MPEIIHIALAIATSIGFFAMARSRGAWRTHALKLQQVISDYEDELQDEKRLKKAWQMEHEDQSKKCAALIGDRDVLRKQLEISQDTVAMLKTEIDELKIAEQTQAERQAEIEALRKQATDLQVGLRFAKEQRDKFASDRISLSEQRDKLRVENANLADALDRIKGSNAFLVRECEKMDSQLAAIKTALVTQPEPTE